MKKNKIKLESIQLNSFVTNLEKKEKQTIDGGATPATITPTVVIPVELMVLKREVDVVFDNDCACVTFAIWECWSSKNLKG